MLCYFPCWLTPKETLQGSFFFYILYSFPDILQVTWSFQMLLEVKTSPGKKTGINVTISYCLIILTWKPKPENIWYWVALYPTEISREQPDLYPFQYFLKRSYSSAAQPGSGSKGQSWWKEGNYLHPELTSLGVLAIAFPPHPTELDDRSKKRLSGAVGGMVEFPHP